MSPTRGRLEARGEVRRRAEDAHVPLVDRTADHGRADRDPDPDREIHQGGLVAERERSVQRKRRMIDSRACDVEGRHHSVARELVDDALALPTSAAAQRWSVVMRSARSSGALAAAIGV